LGCLAAIVIAEVVSATVDTRFGFNLHMFIVFVLLARGIEAPPKERALLWGLTLLPLIRILSLSLPLANIPNIYWYAIIGAPVLTATLLAASALGYSRRDLGLTLGLRALPLHLAMIPLGVVLGTSGYTILGPTPLASSPAPDAIWLPALILTVSVALPEELLFRGLIQRAALQFLGRWGILYVAMLSASLQVGYLSVPHVEFACAVGLIFATARYLTRSVAGVVLARASLCISLLLVAPFTVSSTPKEEARRPSIAEVFEILSADIPTPTSVTVPAPGIVEPTPTTIPTAVTSEAPVATAVPSLTGLTPTVATPRPLPTPIFRP
jgi:membrane protease YdiL (CAAX protease family)